MLSSIPFRWFLGANIAKEYIWLALAAMLPFWRKYALGIQGPVEVFGANLGPGDAEAILLGLSIMLAIPCLLIWRPDRAATRLPRAPGSSRRWSSSPVSLIMTFANDFYTGLAGTLLVAPGLAGSMIMPFPVISEIIDDDAKRNTATAARGSSSA